MGKKVTVDGKEVRINTWKEFNELIEKEKGKHIELKNDDDPEIYIDISHSGDYHAVIKSNWYFVKVYASEVKPLDEYMTILFYHLHDWWSYEVIKRENVFDVFFHYKFGERPGRPSFEINYLTYFMPIETRMLLMPLNKIVQRIRKYIKD